MPMIPDWLRPTDARAVPRAATAIALALTINAAFVWLLAELNARPTPDPAQAPAVRTVLMTSPRQPQQVDQKQEPEPEEPEPAPLVVDLDAPTPQTPELQPTPVSLDLPSPSIAPIHVTVPVKAAPPAPSAQSKAAPPKPSPLARQSNAPLDADRVDQPPREHEGNPAPKYPSREQRRGIEGEVVMKILIDERGRVENIEMIRGRDSFADAVLDVVRQWRFTPARHEGRPVKVWGVKTIRFQLQG